MRTKFQKGLVALPSGLLVVSILLSICGCARKPLVNHVIPKRGPSDFVGKWIGFTSRDDVYFSLNLSSNGTSSLTQANAKLGKIDCYVISNWFVVSNQAICEIQSATNQDNLSRLVCIVQNPTLISTLYGNAYGGWKEDIRFRRREIIETNFLMLGIEIRK